MQSTDTLLDPVRSTYVVEAIPDIRVLETYDLPTIHKPAVVPRRQYDVLKECIIVGLFLAVAIGARLYAAFHTGLEVDEPIYRYAAAYAAQYGFPAVRAEANREIIPFLYHPPFFLWLLDLWFKLWNSDNYLTGRLFSVLCSTIMLGLLYAFVRIHINKSVALLSLIFIASDAWIIFTNQAIYFENSEMVFIILAIWAYWRALQTDGKVNEQYVSRYLLAGLLIGWVLVYKQIGGFLVIVVLANVVMQRKHWLGHVLLCATAFGVLAVYALSMHIAFGSLFDYATLTQIRRTLWERQSAGLTYSPATALEAIVSRYFIFPLTILTLVGGSLLAIVRFVQHIFGKRKEKYPLLLSWVLGGVVFALSISLKSPHYMILWLVPLYIFLSKELYLVFAKRKRTGNRRKLMKGILLVGLFIVSLWSFQARFMNLPGDTLAQASVYINTQLPSSAVVLTEDYVGVDISPQFMDINLVETPEKVFKSSVTYAALYWSTTEPLPASLGPINQYCIPLKTFRGFKDNIEVCKINKLALASILKPELSPSSSGEELENRKQ